MYYIANQDKQIIGADNELLSLLEIRNLQELFAKTISNQIELAEVEDDTVKITMNAKTVSHSRKSYRLHTLMGDLFLNEITLREEKRTTPPAKAAAQESEKKAKRVIRVVAKPKQKAEAEKEEIAAKEKRVVKLVATPMETKSRGSAANERFKTPHTEKQKQNLLKFVDDRKKHGVSGKSDTQTAKPSPEEKEKREIRVSAKPKVIKMVRDENGKLKSIATEQTKKDNVPKFPTLEKEKEELAQFISASEEDRESEKQKILFPEIETESDDLVNFASEPQNSVKPDSDKPVKFPELDIDKPKSIPKEEAEKEKELGTETIEEAPAEKTEETKAPEPSPESETEESIKPETETAVTEEEELIVFPELKIEEESSETPAKKEETEGRDTLESERIIFPELKKEEELGTEMIEEAPAEKREETKAPEPTKVWDDRILFPEFEKEEEPTKAAEENKREEYKDDMIIFPDLEETEKAEKSSKQTISIPALEPEEEREILKPSSEPSSEPAAEKTETDEWIKRAEPEEREETTDLLKPDDTIPATAEERVIVDIGKLSKLLGISDDDYKEFLDEFIEKAQTQKDIINDINSPKHKKSIVSLSKLAQMLYLDTLSNSLKKAIKSTGEEKRNAIKDFYSALSGINIITSDSEAAPAADLAEEETSGDQLCHLVLDDIKPIHFDFQIQQAASDLGLPISLIKEFVDDFIVQAKEEKETFLNACRKGDMDTIHKTGHKLKGAASNLRINPLADTLEEIQFCEDKSELEGLLKRYWGQFLSFELFMKQSSISKGENI